MSTVTVESDVSKVSNRQRAIGSHWISVVVLLAPSMLLLGVFLLYPLVGSFRLSLLDWNGLGSGARFVGITNWVHLSQDAVFWKALRNNLLLYGVGGIIVPFIGIKLIDVLITAAGIA